MFIEENASWKSVTRHIALSVCYEHSLRPYVVKIEITLAKEWQSSRHDGYPWSSENQICHDMRKPV